MVSPREGRYRDRKTKAEYVWYKYRSILRGKILDVGADKCYLKNYLTGNAQYWGIGLGGHPDQRVDLEKEGVPFADNSFDCVLCLDVLEHLDNLHRVFDDLCRVSRGHVIVSLPNPWGSFIEMLRGGYYSRDRPLKFYNLPMDPPEDRHKWFFGAHEAEEFIRERAGRNNMSVVQIDRMDDRARRVQLLAAILSRIVHDDVDISSLFAGTTWGVLRKNRTVFTG